MKHLKLFSLLFFTLTCIASNAQQKDWTLLIYVVGSDIVQDAITDIEEMKAAGNTDNINIVGLLGGSANEEGWATPASSVFIDGTEFGEDFLPSDLTTMASSSNLTEFINWAIDKYPAERYMLAFYNHGMAVRGFGHDNVSNSQFTIPDLKEGIEKSNFIINGNKFDIIAYDACLMACIEAQSAMKDLGNYYVASEEEEPWHAWNWTPIIEAMNTQSDITEPALGKIIVDNFIQQSIDNDTKNVTLSMVDLNKISALEDAIATMLAALNDDIYLHSLLTSRARSEEYGAVISDPEISEDMVDIGDLMHHLKDVEPGITAEIDAVLAALDDAVVYEKSDMGKPRATGISMYLPMNVFRNVYELDYRLDEVYIPLNFVPAITNFIVQNYVEYGLADDAAVSGTLDENTFGFGSGGGSTFGVNYSAIKIPSTEIDLHQVQVVLLEEIVGDPDEYLMLGSSLPDTSTVLADGSTVYGYRWDEHWLGINGHPAYIADIQEFDAIDENDEFLYSFTQIHIPALLHPGETNETEIVLTYDIFENGDYILEEVRGEHYGTGIITPSREIIQLKAGDRIQFIYEKFDAVTHEGTFFPNAENTITIVSGEDDLELEYDRLGAGKYHVGFVLMDHAHNDTLIYDPQIREVFVTSNKEVEISESVLSFYPNPVDNILYLEFKKPTSTSINLIDMNGKEIYRTSIKNATSHQLNVEGFPAGSYVLKLMSKEQVIEKVIIKK